MKTTAKVETVRTAVRNVNETHGYQLELKRLDVSGKWVNFTLKSKSGIPGARLSGSGRNIPCASWHSHGYVMDEIFRLEPEATIYSLGKRIDRFSEWEDKNIGSNFRPCFMSETSIL